MDAYTPNTIETFFSKKIKEDMTKNKLFNPSIPAPPSLIPPPIKPNIIFPNNDIGLTCKIPKTSKIAFSKFETNNFSIKNKFNQFASTLKKQKYSKIISMKQKMNSKTLKYMKIKNIPSLISKYNNNNFSTLKIPPLNQTTIKQPEKKIVLNKFKYFSDKTVVKRKNLLKKIILTLTKLKNRQIIQGKILISLKEKNIVLIGLKEFEKYETDQSFKLILKKMIFLIDELQENQKNKFELNISSIFSKEYILILSNQTIFNSFSVKKVLESFVFTQKNIYQFSSKTIKKKIVDCPIINE